MKPRCDNCRFWVAEMEECHRYAPRAIHWQFYGLCLALANRDEEATEIVGDHGSDADFPRTNKTNWCGEHEPA